MSAALRGKTIGFLVANEGVEEIELTEPWNAVEQSGGMPLLIAPRATEVQAFNHVDKASVFDVDADLDSMPEDQIDALVIPGGVINADNLRLDQQAVNVVRQFAQSGKPTAVICHGPWILIEADLVRGRRMTSWPSLKTDIRNAGGDWVDEEVVVCEDGPNTLVTSRKPDDLKAFCVELVEQFAVTR